IAALIGAPSHGWLTGATLGRLGLAAALSTAFVAVERRHARPMVDLALFGQPRFVGAVVAMFGYAACAQVMMTFLPLYLQNAFGMSAIDAGLGMLPFALAMIVGPSLGEKLAARMSSGGVLAGGLALIGVGNLATALLTAGADYRLVALGICVTGCGAGIMNGDTQKAIIACVPRNRTGMASGISTTTRFSAIVTAVGVLGAVLARSTHAQLVRRLSAMPDVRAFVDARFMSSLLAGDLTQALARLPPTAARVLHDVAPVAFAAGFSTALTVSGVLALVGAAVAYWLLVQPMRDVGM
ncbi:MFS transporter, partial [Burkholderia vietnamiensis]|uniref:MFS transporter n=1 Tax=Burkholderia vietnamiensis TaxID=60552 RepID=UPI002DD433F9